MNVQLQATCASVTASGDTTVLPHHPITCQGELGLEEDGTLWCSHAKTEPGDVRTQAAIVHSIAIAIIEEAVRTL